MGGTYDILVNYMDKNLWDKYIGPASVLSSDIHAIAYDGDDDAAFYKKLQMPYVTSGLGHPTNKMTAANMHDVNVGNGLLRGNEEKVYGDSGYLGIEKHSNSLSAKKYHIMARPSQIKKLPQEQQEQSRNQQTALARVRAKVEHCFATVKRLFG